MSDTIYSPDFQHPDTGVPIWFVWSVTEELLWLEPCESLCQQWEVSENEYQETVTLCKLWGEHTCRSAIEANRIIQERYPDILEDGVYFPEA